MRLGAVACFFVSPRIFALSFSAAVTGIVEKCHLFKSFVVYFAEISSKDSDANQ